MNRREARQLSFELLFSYTYVAVEDRDAFYDRERTLRGFEENEYVRDVVVGVNDNLAVIDEKIDATSSGWGIGRISRSTLSILRLSVYEMLFRTDIPYNISINEAVELAKQYDNEAAPSFINGILNAIAEKEGLKRI